MPLRSCQIAGLRAARCRCYLLPLSRLPQVERRTHIALRRVRVGAGGDGAGDVEGLQVVPWCSPVLCADCGTSLSYEDERLPGEVYLMLGAFDDPDPFEPEAHD